MPSSRIWTLQDKKRREGYDDDAFADEGYFGLRPLLRTTIEAAAGDLPSIALNMYVSGANYACMAFHYWLVYSAASLKPAPYLYGRGSPPAASYAQAWLDSTDRESNNYLRRDSFADSVGDCVGAAVKVFSLTKSISGPAAALNSMADQHFGDVQGDLLRMQETPHRVALQMDDVRLLRYDRRAGRQPPSLKTPFVIVYAPINRHHIMDIRRGRSVVGQFVDAGFDVFLVDWGEQKNNRPTLSDYMGYMRRSIEHVKRRAQRR